jgi:uncharacterized RDD family membrane protein YckC
VASAVQCPQCGFLEFDEHSGCGVCGFQSQAALKTGHPALKPTDFKLKELRFRPRENGTPPIPRESAPLKPGPPLFNEPGAAKRISVPVPEPLWREELEEKLRQYRTRRGGQKNEWTDRAGLHASDKGRASSSQPRGSNKDLAAALDEAFKLHPSDAPAGKDRFGSSLFGGGPATGGGLHRPPGGAPGFELPDSAQRMKQRQSPRRSDPFQQPLLFEASTVAHRASTDGDHPGLSNPVASIRERFLAAGIDFLIVGAVETMSILPLAVLVQSKGWSLTLTSRSVMAGCIIFMIFALLYVFLFSATMGRTLGMHLRGLVLVNFAGESPSLKETTLRAVGYLVSAGSLLLGFIWVFFDVDALAWHDRISRTYPTKIHSAMPDR